MRQRTPENATLRALYLIGILFVVDGHIPLGELCNFGGLFRYYSFHLMLFAFGSGYFFAREDGLAALARSARRTLIPLYAFNLLYGVGAALLRRFFGATLGAPLSAYTLLLAPLVDGQHFAYNLGAWFVSALLLCKALYLLVDALCARLRCGAGLAFILCLIPGALAVTLCQRGRQDALPLFLMRALILLPGYAGGALYRRHLEARDTLPTLPYLVIVVVLRALLCTRYENLAYLLSDCSYFACDALGVYLGGTLAIAFYLRLARLLAPLLMRSKAARYASRHTFAVMMHHYMGFYLLNLVFLAIHVLGLGAADFSVRSLRETIGYVYSPGGRVEWAALYLLAGVGFSLGMAWITDRVSIWARGLRRGRV